MWPAWTCYGMAMLAAFLFGILCYPIVTEMNAKAACWWIRRKLHQDQLRWIAQRAARMREGVR